MPADELPEHGQLATYQLAVEHGAFAGLGCESGGAELVQVGKAGGKDYAVQAQPPLSASDDPGWARTLVLEVAEGMAGLGVPRRRQPLLHDAARSAPAARCRTTAAR